MTSDADHLRRIRPVAIPPADLARWEALGAKVLDLTPAVALELDGLRGDPCLHRMGRVAGAARYAAKLADEPLKTELVALAEEMEERHK